MKRLLLLVLLGATLMLGYSLGRRTPSAESEDGWSAMRSEVEQGWRNAVAVGRRAMEQGAELAGEQAVAGEAQDAEPDPKGR